MSRTIEIPDDVYGQLEQQARQRGLTLVETIAALVHAAALLRCEF